jgi:hypothetical protein
MQENNGVNNSFEDCEIFVYPSILSGDDKMRIVSDILLGNQSIKSSAAKYNIKVKLLQKYVRKVRNGKRLYADLGRPKLLDREAIVAVKDYCIEESELNICNLKFEIKCEHMNTLNRRGGRDIEFQEMSRRSLKRYLDDFLDLESECVSVLSESESEGGFYNYLNENN